MNLTTIIPAFGLRTHVQRQRIEFLHWDHAVLASDVMPVFCVVSFDRHSEPQGAVLFSLC